MYVESVSMTAKLANKITKECDLVLGMGAGLAIGYLMGLTMCIAYLH